jgi:N-acetylglucosamine-6-phosphate deacetylase
MSDHRPTPDGRQPAEAFAVRGDLLLGNGFEPGALVIEGGRVTQVLRAPRQGDLPATVREAAIVAPGLIDLQVNGGYGVEVGADAASLRLLAERLPESGVTAYLPTVVSAEADFYARVFSAFVAGCQALGTRALGVHLEGPFLAPTRRGAHRGEAIEAADDALFAGFLAADVVRLVTLAPERAGALERIGRLVERGVLVSLGHTDATCEEMSAGADAGATMATHLYNAMSPFRHRAPGAIGAALTDDRLTIGLVADGVHSHPASLRLAVRAKGAERIALVTDMMAAAGMPPGDYALGGQRVIVDETSARLTDGTLAGAILTLDEAVRNMVRWTEATPAEALRMASEVPARLLGLADAGRLVAGARADLVLLDRDLRVEETLIDGRTVYRREGRSG